MEVILLEKMQNLGNLGDTVKVKPGYGRNFLLPQHKAVMATPDNLARFEERRAELEKAAAEALAAAQKRAEGIANLGTLTLHRKSGDEGKLYGSVAAGDIAEALDEAGVEVHKQEVTMPTGPIRQTGEYEVELRLHSDVVQPLTVEVVGG
ncbi:MAG TPA: 50S ribosomal protein L9 [Gammaproteobacteria bacterium]|nr:50S ribosomal protein L9 [Gammaproteobacteria bacterium]